MPAAPYKYDKAPANYGTTRPKPIEEEEPDAGAPQSYAPGQPSNTTFKQMQEQGVARPPEPPAAPMPAGPSPYVAPAAPAPIPTMSGDWTPPTAAAGSAPLIASAAGGTMTPQGDAGNAFRGYVSSEGGTFGQADTGDRSQALRALESISGIDSGTTYQGGVYGGGDATKFGLGANATSAEITALSKLNGLVANGDPAGIQQALASGNPWLMANAQRELDKHPELAQPGAVGRLAGNSTAANPAEQAAGLAAQELPPLADSKPFSPYGRSEGVPGIDPEAAVPATGGPMVNVDPGTAGVPGTTSATTGAGTPGVPGKGQLGGGQGNAADILQQLLTGVSGQGAGSAVADATQEKILDQLKSPNAYGSEAVKSAYDWMGGNIDDQYTTANRDLEEEMARRGLSVSTIGSGRTRDLNVAKRTAKESLAQDLGQKMAESQQSATGQAIAQGIGGGTSAQQNQQSWLQQLLGYGQQGFENDMATNRVNTEQDQNWQDFLLKLMGMGYGGATA